MYLAAKLLFLATTVATGGTPYFSLLSEGSLPWFMLSMAWWILIARATRSVPFGLLMGGALVISLAVGYDGTIVDGLCLSRTITMLPFYLVGYRLCVGEVLAVCKGRHLSAIAVATFLVFASACLVFRDEICVLRPLATGRNPYSVLAYPALGPLYRAAWYALAGSLVFAALVISTRLRATWMSRLGRRTFSVYLLHFPVLVLLSKVLQYDVLVGSPAGKLVMLLLCVPVTLVCSWKPIADACARFQALWTRGWEPGREALLRGCVESGDARRRM